MNKNLLRITAILTSALMLTGCTVNINSPAPVANHVTKAELKPDDVNDDNNNTDVTNPDNPEVSEGNEPEVDIPVTVAAAREYISNEAEAKESAIIRGYDADNNVIWEYQTEEIYVGQYVGISLPEITADGVYFVCDGKLYCIDITTKDYGKVKWVGKEDVGHGCSMTFDEEGNIYVVAYDAAGYYVYDKSGNVINHIEYFQFNNPDDALDCFWNNSITYIQGYVVIYFDSISASRTFEASTGCEGFPEIDFSDIEDTKWIVTSREVEGDFLSADEMEGSLSVEIDANLNISIYEYDDNGKVVNQFKNMEAIPQFDFAYIYGDENARLWKLECTYDEENCFDIFLRNNNELEIYWYLGRWDADEYPIVVVFKFALEE